MCVCVCMVLSCSLHIKRMSDPNTSDDDINLEEMAEVSAEEYATANNNNNTSHDEEDNNSSENNRTIITTGWIHIPSGIETKRHAIDEFLNKVTVNSDVGRERENRLKLLSHIRSTMNVVAQFSKIEG